MPIYKKRGVEDEFKPLALEYLNRSPLVSWAERMNTGAKGYIKFGFPGLSDIIGMMKDGRFLAVELKRIISQKKKDRITKATDDQVKFIAKVRSSGGIAGIAVDTSALKANFDAQLSVVLEKATLDMPADEWAVRGGRKGYHTEHLGHMLSVMQSVHRAYPGCEW